MAAFILIFLILSALNNTVSPQPPRQSHIVPGTSLTLNTPAANSTWRSPSGLFAFGFFHHKNAYAIGIFTDRFPGNPPVVVWTANTDDPTVSSDAVLQFNTQGRLVVQQTGREDVQIANPPQAATSASILDNGNFLLYANNSVIWQSFENPTNTLLPGQRLPPGTQLVSSSSDNDYTRGFFRIKMQTDGNLVQYPVNTADTSQHAYYSSGTDGAGSNVSLHLDTDGRLYLLNGTAFLQNISRESLPEGTLYLLRIDVDGIARLYSHPLNERGNWSVKWEAKVDKCAAKGLCGFNSFCYLNDDAANCQCLPDFSPTQQGNRTAGCARNFNWESCGEKNSKAMYEMRVVENSVWDNNPYAASFSTLTLDGCKAACLDDCNCGVAFYNDGQCTKQMLPLRYGKRSTTETNSALVKVRMQASSVPDTNEVVIGSRKESKKLGLGILFIGVGLIIVSALFLVISVIYNHRNRKAYKKVMELEDGSGNSTDVAPRALSYASIARATNDFAEEIGSGSSGTVFKGLLHATQSTVAVKRLEKETGGEKEFQTEMKTIGKTYHRNLVRLLGYCFDGPKRLLVFEYMQNGTLADILFNPDSRPCWDNRINIALDIARGIQYLHEECITQIIHCDIKPQNILMDEHGTAKISDFGLAKLIKQNQTHTYTGVRGTRGYVAPEWHRNQPITVKADVYSFGIVLLEIICCRRSINWNLSDDEAVLEEWVYDCYEAREVGQLVGDEIVDKGKLERMVKIGIWCIQYEPSLRPSMKKVLLMLEGTVDIPIPPNPTSFLSSM